MQTHIMWDAVIVLTLRAYSVKTGGKLANAFSSSMR